MKYLILIAALGAVVGCGGSTMKQFLIVCEPYEVDNYLYYKCGEDEISTGQYVRSVSPVPLVIPHKIRTKD